MNCTCYTQVTLNRPVENAKITSGLHYCPLHQAAPDMLEALKGLFEQCAMIHKHWGDGDNTKLADKAIALARAAIAKAEGRSP